MLKAEVSAKSFNLRKITAKITKRDINSGFPAGREPPSLPHCVKRTGSGLQLCQGSDSYSQRDRKFRDFSFNINLQFLTAVEVKEDKNWEFLVLKI